MDILLLLASAAIAVTFTKVSLDLKLVFRLCGDSSNISFGRQRIPLCDLVVSDLCLTITLTYLLEDNTIVLDLVASVISSGLGK